MNAHDRDRWVLKRLQMFGPQKVQDLLPDYPASRSALYESLGRLEKIHYVRRDGLYFEATDSSRKRPENVQKTSRKRPENVKQAMSFEPENLISEADEMRFSGSDNGVQKTSRKRPAQWFVCCSWYHEDGTFWAHGEDGYPVYRECVSRAEAERVAFEHARMPHQGRPSYRPVFPNADVCVSRGGGKELVQRVGRAADVSEKNVGSLRRDVQWLTAIRDALKKGLRHSPECSAEGRAASREGRDIQRIPGCPWCDFVYAVVDAPPASAMGR